MFTDLHNNRMIAGIALSNVVYMLVHFSHHILLFPHSHFSATIECITYNLWSCSDVDRQLIESIMQVQMDVIGDIQCPVNPCLFQPCLNYGRCVRQDSDYFCECTAMWSGDNCEIREYMKCLLIK